MTKPGAIRTKCIPEGYVFKVMDMRDATDTPVGFGCHSQTRSKMLMMPGPGIGGGSRINDSLQRQAHQVVSDIELIALLDLARQCLSLFSIEQDPAANSVPSARQDQPVAFRSR